MGIPKFFRWISERYPAINRPVTEADSCNSPEMDNLYLDMNGIIHQCTHPPGVDLLREHANEEEMFVAVTAYIERIFMLVKPRKLLMMAVDGVAPRAKMNQQRARRFRSARETEEAYQKEKEKDSSVLPRDEIFDTNCITPGTGFMLRLSQYIQKWIQKKLATDHRWRSIRVLYSGMEVPGEGEHKIMQYIREMKAGDDWDPNTTHVMYGLDADLVMLALVTHEPHFALLREDVLKRQARGSKEVTFHYLHISILREYLDLEFRGGQTGPKAVADEGAASLDLERIIDDFVFMCYFVGNDFLPNLPFLDIADNALNRMFAMYRKMIRETETGDGEGYLTEAGSMRIQQVQRFLTTLCEIEKEGFGIANEDYDDEAARIAVEAMSLKPFTLTESDEEGMVGSEFVPDEELAKDVDRFEEDNEPRATPDAPSNSREGARTEMAAWKHYYYAGKWEEEKIKSTQFHKDLRLAYMEGLQWVLHYYYDGCCSWGWYFPYHYAPLASDLAGMSSEEAQFEFEEGTPFTPFQQLLSVLPSRSRHCLPKAFHPLMTTEDSPIIDFYPEDFELDLNGKKNDWEAVILIPFIDERRLLDAVSSVDPALIPEAEAKGNERGCQLIYQSKACRQTIPDRLEPQPNIFPDCVVYRWEAPPRVRDNPFVLLDGASFGVDAPARFPTLHTLEGRPVDRFAGVNVFGNVTRQNTLVLTFEAPALDRSNQVALRNMVDSYVFVDYPYLSEAMVTSVTTIEGTWVKESNSTVFLPAVFDNNGGNREWDRKAQFLRSDLLTKKGIDVTDVAALVEVRMVTGLETHVDGSKHRALSQRSITCALNLVVDQISNRDERFAPSAARPLEERLSEGSSVFINGGKFKGHVGVVKGHSKTPRGDVVMVEIDASDTTAAGDGGDAKRIAEHLSLQWFPIHEVAKRAQIPSRVLSQLTGNVNIGKINLGLQLKYTSRGTAVMGYAQQEENRFRQDGRPQWVLSNKTVDVLREYKLRFPDVMEAMINYRGDFAHAQPESLLPDLSPKEAFNRLREVRHWIKELECSQLGMTSASARGMSPHALQQVEKKMLHKENNRQKSIKKTITVDSAFVELPVNGAEMRVGRTASALLGDRVRFIRSSHTIPFNLTGTVVGLKGPDAKRVVDVVFDEEFPGGSTLGGQLQTKRGARDVLLSDLLVLGNGARGSQTTSRGRDRYDDKGNYNNRNLGGDFRRDGRSRSDGRRGAYGGSSGSNNTSRSTSSRGRSMHNKVQIAKRPPQQEQDSSVSSHSPNNVKIAQHPTTDGMHNSSLSSQSQRTRISVSALMGDPTATLAVGSSPSSPEAMDPARYWLSLQNSTEDPSSEPSHSSSGSKVPTAGKKSSNRPAADVDHMDSPKAVENLKDLTWQQKELLSSSEGAGKNRGQGGRHKGQKEKKERGESTQSADLQVQRNSSTDSHDSEVGGRGRRKRNRKRRGGAASGTDGKNATGSQGSTPSANSLCDSNGDAPAKRGRGQGRRGRGGRAGRVRSEQGVEKGARPGDSRDSVNGSKEGEGNDRKRGGRRRAEGGQGRRKEDGGTVIQPPPGAELTWQQKLLL